MSCGLECTKKCPYEGNDLSWVQRRGGCPILYAVEVAAEKQRVGQQKGRGKKGKKAGKWKNYNNAKTSKKYGMSLNDRLMR